VSASELADMFNVQAPTMDYHLNKLVQSGRLILLDKRGKYNKKIYKLPSEHKDEDIEAVYDQNDLSYFQNILNDKIKKSNLSSKSSIETEDNVDQHPKEEKSVPEESKELDPIDEVVETEIETPSFEPKLMETKATVESKKEETSFDDLSLDSRIEYFLNQSANAPTADRLLKEEDREILSVMNESIHQNIVYLKDLSEQLSTVENKQLIQELIDERNEYLKEKSAIQDELQILRAQVQEKTGNFDLDPERIRLIQQNMFNVLDMYLDQPNHTLALSRRDFRSAMTKQINEAFTYILNLEK